MFSQVIRQSTHTKFLSSATKGLASWGSRQTAAVAAWHTTANNFDVATRHLSVRDYDKAGSEARHLKTSFDLIDPTSVDMKKHQLTKIVATIGPTSEQLEPLQKVVNAGMKIMRLNFSHATKEEVELRLKNLALSQVSGICICSY